MNEFYELAKQEEEIPFSLGGAIKFNIIELGTLTVPTGKLITTDVLYLLDWKHPTLVKTIPPGNYPIHVFGATFTNFYDSRPSLSNINDWRPAFLQMTINQNSVEHWEIAEFNYEGVKFHDFMTKDGYGVDSGTGGIIDIEALDALHRNFDDPDVFACEYEEKLSKDRYWKAILPIESEKTLNFALSSSGFGDGTYFSYWGFDADGSISKLVTDFHLDTDMDQFYAKK